MNLNEARNILGVSNNASEEEIKKAYKRLAIKWHPDRHSEESKSEAEEKFAKISAANDILLNPEKASQNRFGGFHQEWYQQRKRTYSPIQHGEDILSSTTITLEDAVQGIRKKINVNKPFVCKTCNGLGLKKGKKRTECSSCNGSGSVTIRQKVMGAEFHGRHTCPACQGVGSIIKAEDACEDCKGKKTIVKPDSIEIDIPSGVRDGMKLGANDLGGEGIAGGRNGRLFIDISVDEHEHYKIIDDGEGNDLRLDYNISYYQHYHGDTVEIKTIYGDKIDVKIPPCHDVIDPIIKSGYGLPGPPNRPMRMHDIEKGDLKIYLNIYVPERLEDEEVQAIEKLNYNVENKINDY